MPFDEAKVLKQSKQSPEAFTLLYEYYVDRIYAYVYLRVFDKPTAEDITASVFEKALAHIHSFSWKGISFGAYLFRIARNEIIDYGKESNRLTDFFEETITEPSTEYLIRQQEDYEELYIALNKLSDRDRDIIRLRFFLELSSSEVAKVLNCSVEDVYLRLHRALKRLSKELALLSNVAMLRRKNNVTP